jgi:hypothetical protein
MTRRCEKGSNRVSEVVCISFARNQRAAAAIALIGGGKMRICLRFHREMERYEKSIRLTDGSA